MFPRRFTRLACAAALTSLASLAPLSAQAAPTPAAMISATWGAATTVSGDLDILTTGTLVYAYNFGGTSVAGETVNGVSFSPWGVAPSTSTQTVGSVTLSETPGRLQPTSSTGSIATPFSSLSTAYQGLLSNAIKADQPATMTLLLGGLTIGQTYSLQLWSSDSSGNNTTVTTVTGTATVNLDANTTDVAGGLGQYVIGTFTASAATMRLTLASSGADNPLIDALQLRTYAPAAVPLPATLALLLAALPLMAAVGTRARSRD